MKNYFLNIVLLFFPIVLNAQVCVLEGQTFTPSSLPLHSYIFPSDTTDELITNTYISITYDSLYYADVLSYKKECISMYIVKAGLKDLKNDVGFKVDELTLNGRKNLKGALLQVYTSIYHNVFISKNGDRKYGWTEVPGNVLNIICPDKASADWLANEIDTRVKSK